MPKTKTKTKKKRETIGNGPMMATRPRAPGTDTHDAQRLGHAEQRRQRRRLIIARTAAGRAAIDAYVADADMTDVQDLPVITGLTPPDPSIHGKTRKQRKTAPLGMAAVADEAFMAKMATRPRAQRPQLATKPVAVIPRAAAPEPSAVPAPV